ncbi:hypothetical protein PT115_03415 [Erysipelothrix rhusiopathiae]|nr:hypothetical protein [Erysipelothrix rhusiopathiae]
MNIKTVILVFIVLYVFLTCETVIKNIIYRKRIDFIISKISDTSDELKPLSEELSALDYNSGAFFTIQQKMQKQSEIKHKYNAIICSNIAPLIPHLKSLSIKHHYISISNEPAHNETEFKELWVELINLNTQQEYDFFRSINPKLILERIFLIPKSILNYFGISLNFNTSKIFSLVVWLITFFSSEIKAFIIYLLTLIK